VKQQPNVRKFIEARKKSEAKIDPLTSSTTIPIAIIRLFKGILIKVTLQNVDEKEKYCNN
jgi:hypothetical protein